MPLEAILHDINTNTAALRTSTVKATLLGSSFCTMTVSRNSISHKFLCILYEPILYIHNHNPGDGARLFTRLHLENFNALGKSKPTSLDCVDPTKIGQKMLCTKGPFIYNRSYLASQNRLEAQEQKQAPLSFPQHFVLLYDFKKKSGTIKRRNTYSNSLEYKTRVSSAQPGN
jgi:hypothetical protein